MPKFVGHYTSPKLITDDPDYLDVLKDQLGLTTVIMGAGYNFSAEVRARNPLPPSTSPGRGPGIGISDDDSLIRKAIDAAHNKGVKVWLSAGGFRDGTDKWPDLLAVDMSGRPLSEAPRIKYAMTQDSIPFCPSNEKINEWFRSAYAEIAKLYDADGLDVTHYRYTSPSFFDNLFGCACELCQKRANGMGYDFEKMRKSVLSLLDKLRNLNAKDVKEAGDLGLTFLDLVQCLGHDAAGAADWFDFRVDVVTENMVEISEAVHNVARDGFVFGMDSYVPSLSMLVGHRYSDYKKFSAYTSSLISWTDFFILSTFAAHANLLCEWIEGLKEEDALRTVYSFYGYGDLPMPERIEDMELGKNPGQGSPDCVPIYEIMGMEMRKARVYNDGTIPSHPIVKGIFWPGDVVRRLTKAAEEMGHEGIIYHQGTSSVVDHPKAKQDAYSPS